ncbi:MAG: alpha-L-rhamnosidase N-terminal domain-containing protein [Bacteroidetes bacterium]|nr:alpha-L-rhamnosidase N-terminal domain-containing protein [Bacteroidota bacterium]
MRNIFLLLSCILTYSLVGQNLWDTGKVKGGWTTEAEDQEANAWKAQWIWLDNEEENHMMLSRKSFLMDELPENAILKITATSQYKLYINGQYLLQGPARSAPHHQYYDELEITPLLQKGINTIAVKVHYQDGQQSYHFPSRPGLLAQLNLTFGDEVLSISTDKSWKVIADPSWDNSAPLINRFQDFVNDKVDFRKKIGGWYNPTFDDTTWPPATLVYRNVGWPTHQKNSLAGATTLPWINLIRRDLPYLIETDWVTTNLIKAEQIESPNIDKMPLISILPSEDISVDPTIPFILKGSKKGKSWFLLYDFGQMINGNPRLSIEGEKGIKVEILTAPYQINGFFRHTVVHSNFRDQIILSGGLDQWESTYFKPSRYLALVIHSQDPVKVVQVGSRKLEYPFKAKGEIQSIEAPWVRQYFDATDKTIKACTTDAYTDNYRERRQYAQTGYYGAMGNQWIFGDTALQRRYLIQTADEQEANGIMPAYAPLKSDDYMIILDSNLLWIRSLYQYYLFSGDRITTQKLMDSALKLMALIHSFTDDLGLINNPPYAYWLDHSDLDRAGANFTLNAHYLGALEDFSQLLQWMDEEGAMVFTQRARLLKSSLQTHFWNAEKGLFSDALLASGNSYKYSEHANGMALALQIADEVQGKSIIEKLLVDDPNLYIKRTNGMTIVTPAMSYFLHKGIAQYGHVDASFDLLRRRFDHMLEPQYNGTLWEEWWLDGTGRSGKLNNNFTRADAQTESAFMPALFAEFLLGIRPSQPGMTEMTIALPQTKIKKIASVIPTPMGSLTVGWDLNEKSKRVLQLIIPEGMKVKLEQDSFDLPKEESILVNGTKTPFQSINPLGSGSWELLF